MRYILILLPILLLTSCSSLQFRYATLNYAASVDGIYSSQPIQVEVIDNDWDFSQKLRTDWKFRNDFTNYAINQDLSWYYRNYNYLGGWRSGITPFDLYWNRFDLWWNWSVNYPFTYWNNFRTRDILGFGWGQNRWNNWNNFGWNNWNYRPYIPNRRIIRNTETPRRNVVRVRGSRGSTNTQIRQPRTNTSSVDRVIREVNQGRRISTDNRVINRPNTRTPQQTQVRQPQPIRRVQPPQRTQVREAVKQTQPTRRSSSNQIKQND